MNHQYGFATVVFATPQGGVHKQRITWASNEGPSKLIPRAVKGCKRKGIMVANVLEISRGGRVLFSPLTALRFW